MPRLRILLPVVLVCGGMLGLGAVQGLDTLSDSEVVTCVPVEGDGQCARQARDDAERVTISASSDSPAVDSAVKQVSWAVDSPKCVTDPAGENCLGAVVPHTPTNRDVDSSRLALAQLGFDDVAVRLATSSDPAPAGSVLAAVRVGDSCVLSSALIKPTEAGHGSLVC